MEVRKACPQDRSPSNSVGKAGGGGHPAGTTRVIVDTFFGKSFSSDIIPSRCLNPIINTSNCFCVSLSLACESARACSKASRRSLTGPKNACCAGFMVRKSWGGVRDGRVHRMGGSQRWSPTFMQQSGVFSSHCGVSPRRWSYSDVRATVRGCHWTTYISPAKCQAKLDIASFWLTWLCGWSFPNSNWKLDLVKSSRRS